MCGFVGVLDSGVGGLTVLRQLQKIAPHHNFVYVADHAFCPYGTRPSHQIVERVFFLCRALVQRGATSLVLACNTASVFAAEIRHELHLPVFEVVSPTCCEVVRTTHSKRVALLATNSTVQNAMYRRILQAYDISVFAFPCSNFVQLVENNAPQHIKNQCVQKVMDQVLAVNADTLVLGCTHFPYLQKEIAAFAPHMQIVGCAQPLAKVFAQSNLLHCGSGKTRYFTTSSAAVPFASQFANENFSEISL